MPSARRLLRAGHVSLPTGGGIGVRNAMTGYNQLGTVQIVERDPSPVTMAAKLTADGATINFP